MLHLLALSSVHKEQETRPLFSPEQIDIPFHTYTLSNGLQLIVHEDHKAPIVAVNIWYHVGSKNERPGKSGFAHLFEHLMFNGSEHFNDDYFQALQAIGATDLNGTTSNDRTNYFQNVPTAALDQVLWLESDRMGHLLGAIDQAKLDEQRGVVKNEKRQKEDQPYGRQWELITHEMFPKGHPYSWTVIGSMEDIDGASLEDVHDWFKAYYGAANAVLVVAGDVDPEDVHERVQKYFGEVPSGPTIVRPEVNIPRRFTDTRASYQDRVPESRIVMVWNTPQMGSREDALLTLSSSILSKGKTSPFYKELVYDKRIASNVVTFQWSKELAGNFIIQANVRPGESAATVEAEINRILNHFLQHGPTQDQLERAKSSYFSSLIKGLERIGGFGGKSDILASSTVFGGSPEAYKEYMQHIANATIEDIQAVCRDWLSIGRYTLVCEPFPDYNTTTTGVDRSRLPDLEPVQSSRFPALARAQLSNGMKIVLARRSGIPTVVVNALFDAGFASDRKSKAGTAGLAMNLIDEGTASRSSLEINEQLQMLGASIATGAGLDVSYVSMNTLLPALDPSLDLFCDILVNPAYPQKEFERLRQAQIDGIQREKSVPTQLALRMMPRFLYGGDHDYGLPMTGSGYEETVRQLSVDDVIGYYHNWITPDNATLVVVGDLTLDQLVNKLEKRLGSWQVTKRTTKHYTPVDSISGNTLYIMDRPGSQQSVIMGGYLIEPYGSVSEIGLEAVNNVLGGQFISRINLNLREDKHWTYGAGSFIAHARGQRPLMVFAPVQWDKTSEAIQEIRNEMDMFVNNKPVTPEEFEKNKSNSVLKLPGKWETNAAVAASIAQIIKFNLADDYYRTYDKLVRDLELEEIHTLSREIVNADRMQWVVVGDCSKILPSLQQLSFQRISLVDGDGNVLEVLSA